MTGRTKDKARMWRHAKLPGLEMFRADFSRHEFSRHSHERYALGIILRGALSFHYHHSQWTAPAGSVNLVVPGEVHDGRGADESGWGYRMFYMHPDLVRNAAREAAHKDGDMPFFRNGAMDDPTLAGEVAAMHRLAEDPNTARLALESQLAHVLNLWITRHADATSRPKRTGGEPGAVTRAKSFLLQNLSRDVSLNDLAGAAGLSAYHFIRVFHRATGLTPHAYLVQERVRKARRTLACPLDGLAPSLADLAQETGFADQSHLTRAFKRLVGVPPGRYRSILQDA